MENKMSKKENKLFFMEFEVTTGDIELRLNHTVTAKNKEEAIKIAGDYVSNYYALNDEELIEDFNKEEADPWRQASFQGGQILASLQRIEEMTAKEIAERIAIN
jgi:hypothetical protein